MRRIASATASLALAAALSAGCGGDGAPGAGAGGTPDASSGPDSAFFAEQWAAYAEALSAGDVEGVASRFAPDARLMEPGLSTLGGRDRIRGAVGSALQQVEVPRTEFLPREVHVHGDRAYELGSFTEVVRPKGDSTGTTHHGRYAAFWRRLDGSWKVSRLILNQLPAGHGASAVPAGGASPGDSARTNPHEGGG
jgi:uncharacterized protein (TIGR02246 family)